MTPLPPTSAPRRLRFIRRMRQPVVLRRMARYVRGEHTPAARTETARLIENSDAAYAAYQHARSTDHDLTNRFSAHGSPDRAQLDRAFSNIGAALNGTAPLYRLRSLAGWRVSAAMIALATLFIVPIFMDGGRMAATSVPTQPQPRAITDDMITPIGAIQAEATSAVQTPQLATAIFIARATPTAPDFK